MTAEQLSLNTQHHNIRQLFSDCYLNAQLPLLTDWKDLEHPAERAHRTHREESYICRWTEPAVAGYQPALAEWLDQYNPRPPPSAPRLSGT